MVSNNFSCNISFYGRIQWNVRMSKIYVRQSMVQRIVCRHILSLYLYLCNVLTDCSIQRKGSTSKSPPNKRQRRQTKVFEFADHIPRSLDGKKSAPVEIAFDKGTYLAIRADGGENI